MTRIALTLALLAAGALGACSALPTAGPTVSDIRKQEFKDSQARFDLVDIDDQVVAALLASPSESFRTRFKKYGKPPDNQAWGDYLSTKHIAQAMNELKTTDSTKIAEHMEKGAKFDVLKGREGYYRNWDHQLMMEMYTIRFKPADQIKNQWDIFDTSPPVPVASASLESIAPTREENNCTMPA